IVATMAMAHAPGVTGWLTSAPQEEQDAILAGYRRMGEHLRASAPDLLIGVANDHLLNLPLHDPPDFCIGTAQHWRGPAEFFLDWLQVEPYELAGNPTAARALAGTLTAEGVRLATSDELLFDDNWSVPLRFLTPDYDVPFVPIHMNCINPPLPEPASCYAAGLAIRKAILNDLPESMRVAFFATGGLSHEPGGKRYFQVEEKFDRWFLDLLATGDVERILAESTIEKMESAGGGGTTELLAWLVALGVATNKVANPVFYVPSVEMRCGIGGVVWKTA